jgi:hypothetical protein
MNDSSSKQENNDNGQTECLLHFRQFFLVSCLKSAAETKTTSIKDKRLFPGFEWGAWWPNGWCVGLQIE